jgi:hypothetical protein
MQVSWQNTGSKVDSTFRIGRLVTYSPLLDLNRTGAGQDLSSWQTAVFHYQPTAQVVDPSRVASNKTIYLSIYRRLKHPPGTFPYQCESQRRTSQFHSVGW